MHINMFFFFLGCGWGDDGCSYKAKTGCCVHVWVHVHVRVFVVWSDSLFDSTRICVELGLKGLEWGPFDSGVHIQVETKASALSACWVEKRGTAWNVCPVRNIPLTCGTWSPPLLFSNVSTPVRLIKDSNGNMFFSWLPQLL